jgi:hypothetical protein
MQFKKVIQKSMMSTTLIMLFTFLPHSVYSQDLLENLEEEPIDYTTATFKTTRVINGHSVENVAGGVLDFRISHRFGAIDQGLYDLFGLDAATMRLGFEYGLTDRLMVGVGRSTYEKSYDGFLKYKILRQSKGKVNMPVTMSYFASTSINTLKWADPNRKNYFTSRLSYVHQLIVGRKLNGTTSVQITPSFVHRNLIKNNTVKNDVFAIGFGGRQKLNSRISLNAEYFYVLPNQI